MECEKDESKKVLSGTDEFSIYGKLVERDATLDAIHAELELARVRKLEDVLRKRCGSVQILLEDLQDPSNGSACMRTAEAYGIQVVHIVENKPRGKGSRGDTSMNSGKWLTVHRWQNSWDAVKAIRDDGFALFATVFDVDKLMPLEGCSVPNSVSIDSVDFDKFEKICLMFGSETRGLTLGLRLTANVRLYLPTRGYVPALNLSPAFALYIYHLQLRNRLRPDLDDETIAQLYRQWIYRAGAKRKQLDPEVRRSIPRLQSSKSTEASDKDTPQRKNCP